MLGRWWQAALDLVFPRRCVACGREGAGLCPSCWATVERLQPPLCPRCGEPGAGVCVRCAQEPLLAAPVRSAAAFTGPLRQAIHALKYEGVRFVAADLAELLIETWQAAGFTADVIVPAPLHPRRWRERGYNQAELLARPLAAATGVPLALDALRRIRYTTPQVAVAGTQRRANVAGAFAGEAAVLAGRRVALVDDVMTTGATLNACADACRVAGATAVLALTVARGL